MALSDDYAYLASLSAHPDRAGDTSNFNPVYATPLANAIRQANAQGLHIGLASGFRPPSTLVGQGRTGPAAGYDAGGNSGHSYGIAGDVSGLDGANGPITQQWAKIATANGLFNPYGIGNKDEYNHWQAYPTKNIPPQTLDALKQASASGDIHNVWSAFNSGGGPSRPATQTPGPLMFAGVNPDARGMRNNNPGNLVASDWVQKLPGYKGTDGKFAIFDTPDHGAAALDQNLTSYGSKGINTPLGIASTWAPASDNNNPNSYGGQIAKALGVGPNDKIDMTDPSIRNKVAQAIGLVENGPGKSAGFRTAYVGSSTPGTTLNSPAVAAGQPAAPAGGLAGQLASSLKPLTGNKGGGQADEPPPMQLRPPQQSQAMGGPMMMQPGGQNMEGRQLAAQDLAQRGFSMQPQLASTLGALGATRPVVPSTIASTMPGQATGMPGMPGTTLNSPSQLQMALMSGNLSPYDMYATAGYGGGFGST